jgi:hypothetical protein
MRGMQVNGCKIGLGNLFRNKITGRIYRSAAPTKQEKS